LFGLQQLPDGGRALDLILSEAEMKLVSQRGSCLAAAVAAGLASFAVSSSQAQTVGTWFRGTGSWATTGSTGWTNGVVPTNPGDLATLDNGNATGSSTTTLDAARSVGTIRQFGSTTGATVDRSWTIALALNQLTLQEPGANPAQIINDLQSETNNGNNTIIFTNTGSGGPPDTRGGLTLADDLQITNTSTSRRIHGSIRMGAVMRGNGNIFINNAGSNDWNRGDVTFLNQGIFGGDVVIQKGAVSIQRGDVFTPGVHPVTIGSAGNGDATLAWVGNSTLGSLEYQFIAAANTGGVNMLVADPQTFNNTTITPVTANVNWKSTITDQGSIVLNGDLTAKNAGLGEMQLGDRILGAGTLTTISNGKTRITNHNTYEGGTIVDTGLTEVGHVDFVGTIFGNHDPRDGDLGSGDVKVKSAGTLRIQSSSAAIDVVRNSAAMNVDGSVDLESGINDTIGGLVLGGVTQTASGTYGAPGSGAAHEDSHFTGSGFVNLQLGRVLYWDANGSTAGAGGATPTGNWNNAALNFNTDSTGGTGGTRTANSLSTDPVVFTAGADGTGTYTVNVTGTQNAASLAVARGNVTLAGGAISTPSVDVASGATATLTGALSSPTSALAKTGAGTLKVAKLPQGHDVSITNGRMQVSDSSPTFPSHPAGDDAAVSRPRSLAITSGATLDLGNNDMIVAYGASTPYAGVSPAAALEDQIAQGFNGGDWLGTGITSSAAASDDAAGNFVLAIVDNANLPQPYGASNGGDNFDGVDVPLESVLVKFTHRVDLNLDGLVTDADAIIFGTFYDTGLAHLPEPASIGLVGIAAAGLLARRRRA
jgi:hypothetical protein